MKALHTLIVDDEPLNRQELRHLLSDHKGIHIIGEAGNSKEALKILSSSNIDLVLLDIQMEETRTGLKIADYIASLTPRPYIIFVTAYPQYSLESFAYEPLHYVTKPINEKILDQALQRAFERTETFFLDIKHRVEEPDGSNLYPVTYVDMQDIRYSHKIKFSNTIDMYLQGGNSLKGIRKTMNELQEDLAPLNYQRTHPSFIVNLTYVERIEPRNAKGDLFQLVLKGSGEKIPISPPNLKRIRELLTKI